MNFIKETCKITMTRYLSCSIISPDFSDMQHREVRQDSSEQIWSIIALIYVAFETKHFKHL